MEVIFALMVVLVPIITGLAEVLKKYVNEKYYALIPLVIGLVLAPLCFGLPFITASFSELIFAGLLSGLSAGGFYSVTNIRNK